MKKTVPHSVQCAKKTNSAVESKEIACQWRNIAMASDIVPMEATKIVDRKRMLRSFQIRIVKRSRDFSLAMTLASH